MPNAFIRVSTLFADYDGDFLRSDGKNEFSSDENT